MDKDKAQRMIDFIIHSRKVRGFMTELSKVKINDVIEEIIRTYNITSKAIEYYSAIHSSFKREELEGLILGKTVKGIERIAFDLIDIEYTKANYILIFSYANVFWKFNYWEANDGDQFHDIFSTSPQETYECVQVKPKTKTIIIYEEVK